jgi:prolyl oligopeptidase
MKRFPRHTTPVQIQFSTPWYGFEGRWYWRARTTDQEQNALYRSPDDQLPNPTGGFEHESNLYFDTNVLSEDGSKSLTSIVYSPDRQLVAYAVTTSGADDNELIICRPGAVRRKEDIEDALVERFSGAWFGYILWSDDSKGFYYRPPSLLARPTPDRGQIFYHVLHSNRSEDRLVVEGESGAIITMFPSNDGKYMLISSSRDTTEHRFGLVRGTENALIG